MQTTRDIENVLLLNDFRGLQGLGDFSGDVIINDIEFYNYLKSTRNAIQQNPDAVKNIQNPIDQIKMFDLVLDPDVWNDDDLREDTLLYLVDIEEQEQAKGNIRTDDSLPGFWEATYEAIYPEVFEGLEGWDDSDFDDDDITELGDLAGRAKRKAKRAKRKAKKSHRMVRRKAHKTKRKKRVRKAVKKAKRTVRKTAKKAIKTMAKVNPVTITVRNAFRTLLAVNFMGVASVIHAGALTEREALAAGYSRDYWQKAKKLHGKVAKLYSKMGGKTSKLDKTLRKGSKRKALFDKKGRSKVQGLGVIDPVTASAITAGGGVLATVIKWIKDLGLGKEVAKIAADKVQNVIENKGKRSGSDNLPVTQDYQVPAEMNFDAKANNGKQNGNAANEKKIFGMSPKQLGFAGVAVGVPIVGFAIYKATTNTKKAKPKRSKTLKGHDF